CGRVESVTNARAVLKWRISFPGRNPDIVLHEQGGAGERRTENRAVGRADDGLLLRRFARRKLRPRRGGGEHQQDERARAHAVPRPAVAPRSMRSKAVRGWRSCHRVSRNPDALPSTAAASTSLNQCWFV